jgi:hypothetical protein
MNAQSEHSFGRTESYSSLAVCPLLRPRTSLGRSDSDFGAAARAAAATFPDATNVRSASLNSRAAFVVYLSPWTPFLLATADFASLSGRRAASAPLVEKALAGALLGVRIMGISSRIERVSGVERRVLAAGRVSKSPMQRFVLVNRATGIHTEESIPVHAVAHQAIKERHVKIYAVFVCQSVR